MFHCCRRESPRITAASSPVISQNDSDSQPQYLQTLDALEQKEKLFAAHDLLDDINAKTMESFIDERLGELLGCKLHELKDEDLAIHICQAYFKQKSVIREWRHMSKLPLFEGLLLAYIFNDMRKVFLQVHEDEIAEEYAKLRDIMDSACTDLITICFRDSEDRTRQALELNYHPFIHPVCGPNHSIRLMEIAFLGKAHKFLAHPACQKAIDRRWQPSYRIGPTSFWLFVYFAFPFLFFINKTVPYSKNLEGSTCIKVWKFYTSPASKYVVHMTCRCIYVVYYSVVLIHLSRRNLHQENLLNSEIYIVMAVQVSYLLELVGMIIRGKLQRWARRNKVDFCRNMLIAFNVVFLVFGLLSIKLRFILFPLADLFFYLSYIMAVIRSMRILYVNSFFGSIVVMIAKMVPTLIKFLGIFVFFWGAFAVCYISLSGHYRAENTTYATLPWQLFYHGAFEIFGEAIDEDKKGDLKSCTNFDLSSYTDSAFHCLFRTWMVPILLFTYILISGILLVNILTALLTKQYEDLSKKSHIYWKVALYARLAEYEESPPAPAPFSLFYYILRAIAIGIKKIYKKAEGYYRKRRRTSPVDHNSVEMAPLVKDQSPPTPFLARSSPSPTPALIPSSSSPGNLQTIAEHPKNVEEERPFQLKTRDLSGKKFYRATARPHSAAGFTDVSIEIPSFEEAGPSFKNFEKSISTVSSKPLSEAPSPDFEDVIAQTVQGVRAISQDAETTSEEMALQFIQDSRDTMVQEQNEKFRQNQAKVAVIARILQKYELSVSSRPRGMTE